MATFGRERRRDRWRQRGDGRRARAHAQRRRLKAKTDIPDNVYEGIQGNKVKVLHLFIRRGVAQAKFSVQELREMEKLPGVQLIINEDDFDLDDETIEVAGKDKLTRQMVEELFAIREMAEDMEDDGDVDYEGNPADRKYYVHFNSAPTEILGKDGKVAASAWRRPRPARRQDAPRRRIRRLPGRAVYHAIGYKPAEAPGITYERRAPIWPTRTAMAASPPRPPAVTCVNACMPPGGPSAGRSA